jgi:hypothetical protein
VAHVHTVEAQHGPSGPASVMADIGGDIGAAVLYTPETLLGSEIEIRPAGHEWDGTHTAVRERRLRDSVRYAGYFASLGAGRYEVRLRGDTSCQVELVVRGGEVAEVTW